MRKTTRLHPPTLCLHVDDHSGTVCDLKTNGVRFVAEVMEGTASVLAPEGNRGYLYKTKRLPWVPGGRELAGERRIP